MTTQLTPPLQSNEIINRFIEAVERHTRDPHPAPFPWFSWTSDLYTCIQLEECKLALDVEASNCMVFDPEKTTPFLENLALGIGHQFITVKHIALSLLRVSHLIPGLHEKLAWFLYALIRHDCSVVGDLLDSAFNPSNLVRQLVRGNCFDEMQKKTVFTISLISFINRAPFFPLEVILHDTKLPHHYVWEKDYRWLTPGEKEVRSAHVLYFLINPAAQTIDYLPHIDQRRPSENVVMYATGVGNMLFPMHSQSEAGIPDLVAS